MNIAKSSVPPLSPELIARFRAIVGDKYAVTDAADIEPYVTEERDLFHGRSPLVLRPGSTAEVSAICKLASEQKIALVPQGGNTGLFGGQAYVTRNFGRFFGVVAQGDYYRYPYTKPVVQNSTYKPSVESVFFGPELHGTLIGKYGAFIHGLIGGEHTGGTSQTPNISFAGGIGGGMEYTLSQRLSVRASGDYIGASFSDTGNSKFLDYSPHKTWNPRASIGVMYRF